MLLCIRNVDAAELGSLAQGLNVVTVDVGYGHSRLRVGLGVQDGSLTRLAEDAGF